MTLISFKEELRKARAGKYAIPMIDVFDVAGIEGVFAAIEEKRAPIMLAVYAHYLDHPNGKAFSAYIRTRAESTSVPVSLILDHGASFEACTRALTWGFTDVMFDGSALPFEENVAITRMAARAAHAVGATAEAELGHVGMGDQYDTYGAQRAGFTDPDMVVRFVAETGVDALAVAFGNAHGLYKGEPHLDLELLADISSRVDIPLVMHGGTGLSDDQFRGAIQAGISKINVATLMMVTAARNMASASQKENATIFSLAESAQTAYQLCSGHVADVFGASGKG